MHNTGHIDAGHDDFPVIVLFFDRYNVEDPLFIADVARRLVAATRSGLHPLVVHAADDAVERALEQVDGLDDAEVGLAVERAVRMTNQSITRRIIDEGVPAVSIQGDQRGLLRVTKSGDVSVGRIDWLERAISMGGVPVLSLLGLGEDRRVVQVSGPSALPILTKCLSDFWPVTLVGFTNNRKSTLTGEDGSPVSELPLSELSAYAEAPEGLLTEVGPPNSVDVVITNSAGISPQGLEGGTRVIC